MTIDWLSRSAEDTEAFGARLAAARPVLNGFAAIHLLGDLGAGKTTLTRGFLRACGVTGGVKSPTYTLMEVYETPGLFVVHLDLYRLADAGELEALGLREWAAPGHLFIIEWPERGAGGLPAADLTIRLTGGAQHHALHLQSGSASGTAWLQAVEKSLRSP